MIWMALPHLGQVAVGILSSPTPGAETSVLHKDRSRNRKLHSLASVIECERLRFDQIYNTHLVLIEVVCDLAEDLLDALRILLEVIRLRSIVLRSELAGISFSSKLLPRKQASDCPWCQRCWVWP